MRYYRCKCGNCEAWGSMPPAPCTRCRACRSDLAEAPSLHQEPSPHRFAWRSCTDDQYEFCTVCNRRRSEVEIDYLAEALDEEFPRPYTETD